MAAHGSGHQRRHRQWQEPTTCTWGDRVPLDALEMVVADGSWCLAKCWEVLEPYCVLLASRDEARVTMWLSRDSAQKGKGNVERRDVETTNCHAGQLATSWAAADGLDLALDSPSRPFSAFENALADTPLLTAESRDLLPRPTALVRAHLVHLLADGWLAIWADAGSAEGLALLLSSSFSAIFCRVFSCFSYFSMFFTRVVGVCRMPPNVRAYLKLDVRLVGSAPLTPMPFHLEVQNDKFMLQRAQKKKSRDKKRFAKNE